MIGSMFRAAAIARLLPPPEPLLKGTKELGYYGRVQSGDFIDGGALITAMGTTTPGSWLNPGSEWLKFSLNSKKLYVARAPLTFGTSWNSLSQRNLIYGGRLVTIRGKQYKVRLLNGGLDAGEDSEWNKLMYPVCGVGQVWDNLTFAQISNGFGTISPPLNANRCTLRALVTGVTQHSLSTIANDQNFTAWRPCLELVE